MSSRRLVVGLTLGSLLVACSSSDIPRLDDGAPPVDSPNQVPPDAPPDIRDASATPDIVRDRFPDQVACPPGMSEADCRRCGPTLPGQCQGMCPTVDCSVYPLPAECVDMCSGTRCCACTSGQTSPVYQWQAPYPAPECGTACTDMLSRWTAYLADPAMVACTKSLDCEVVGGQPRTDPCNGHSTIGYCGKAVNAAAYRASPAASLETQFAATCTGHTAHDCGPGYPACTDGKCTIAGFGCCFGCGPDAALPDAEDANRTPLDLALDVAGEIAGGREAGGGEAGGQ